MQQNPQAIFQQAVQELNAQRYQNVVNLLNPLRKTKLVSPDSLNLMAVAQTHLGKFKEAHKLFSASIKLNKKHGPTYHHLGNLYRDEAKTELALKNYKKAFSLDKEKPRPLMEAALILQNQEAWLEAESFIDRFLRAGGDPFEGTIRKAVCRYSVYHYDEAEALLEKADKLNPGLDIVQYYQALLFDKTKRKPAAEKVFLDLIDRGHTPSLFSLSLLYFSIGKWAEAFALYDHRPIAQSLAQRCQSQHLEFWDTKRSLKNQHVFVYGEQGLGDQIRYLYFLQYLIEDAAKVSMACDERLYPLINAMYPSIECIAYRHPITAERLAELKPDISLCAGSLGSAYGQQLAHRSQSSGLSKSEAAFVRLSSDLENDWKNQLPPNGKANIGISWRSIRVMQERNEWYMDAEQFASLLSGLDANIISLQYGLTDEEREAFKNKGIELVELEGLDLKDDQYALAACLSSLDMVVSVSTALSELAGATGIPTIMFAVEDIRWFMSQAHIRGFYPNAKVCYKKMFCEWSPALEEASTLLGKHVKNMKEAAS